MEVLQEIARQFDAALEQVAKEKNPTVSDGGVKASLSVIGLEEYSKESKNNIKMRGGIIVNSETELSRYVTEALNGNSKQNLHLGAIPNNIINQIEKDINTKIFKENKQYTFVVSFDDIIHISKHFPDVKDLTKEIIRLYDILSNYDSVECLIEDNGRKKLRLEKAYSHADYRSIEIVSNRTSSVDLISFYVTKKHNKKGSQSVPPATQGSLSGGARLPDNTVTQNAQSVNNNDMQNKKKDTVKDDFSRQRIGDAWEDIRTKMYESEVHEDIVNEIEDYITRLRKRKISRETAITEGLIPKYEAVLKVAREYTKGSDVSARELADVINELMWAAHDGNLDTKQFIATVKIFAENIIRTGHKVNDDLYRQYEEFRRMTREETVHVSQEVYDQYVEEYGSVKNLNRACAGKIKIRPYDNNNRTGRALDDFYGELQELYPEMFKEDVDVYHQLFDILDVWQMIQPQTEYFSDILGIKTEGDLHQQSLLIAEDIMSEVLGIKETVKTVADAIS